MASVLTYNGFTLDDIRTVTFSQKPVLTPDKTIHLWDEITIRVNAVLNSKLNPATNGEAPATTYNRIKSCLSNVRQNLTFVNDGITTVNVSAPDAQLGPVPGELSVTEIAPGAWRIEFSVTTWISQCCSSARTPPALLGNVWTDKVRIDQNHYSTYSRSGKLYFRYDLLAAGNFQPDTYRQVILAACPLKNGFMRTQSDYTVQSDWLAIEYSITDVEQYVMPLLLKQGGYITQGSGTVKTSTQLGAMFTEEVNISLTGNRDAKKSELYATAAFMATKITGYAPKSGKIVKSAAFEHDIFENKVSLHMSVQSPMGRAMLKNMNYPTSSLGRVNAWTAQDAQMPDPGSRGTARLQLVANAIQDPCLFAVAQGGAPPANLPQNIVIAGNIKDIS